MARAARACRVQGGTSGQRHGEGCTGCGARLQLLDNLRQQIDVHVVVAATRRRRRRRFRARLLVHGLLLRLALLLSLALGTVEDLAPVGQLRRVGEHGAAGLGGQRAAELGGQRVAELGGRGAAELGSTGRLSRGGVMWRSWGAAGGRVEFSRRRGHVETRARQL
eukprot:1056364-Prymnesium_polylepis.1